MTSNDIDHDVRAIRAAILQWPRPTITGGQLASLISTTAPSLDLRATVGILKGPGALTAFIKKFLSDQLEQVGKQGMDTVHHVKGRLIEQVETPIAPEIWRTFVSPNSKQQLVISKSAERLLSRDRPASPQSDELDLPRATVLEHDRIRAEFNATLTAPVLSALGKDALPEADFEDWIVALREHAPAETKRWGQFRREHLSALLISRVDAAEIDADLRHKLLAQVRASEQSFYNTRRAINAGAENLSSELGSADDGMARALARTRKLAHSAIDKLSYDELRALRVPLGALLDAVGNKS